MSFALRSQDSIFSPTNHRAIVWLARPITTLGFLMGYRGEWQSFFFSVCPFSKIRRYFSSVYRFPKGKCRHGTRSFSHTQGERSVEPYGTSVVPRALVHVVLAGAPWRGISANVCFCDAVRTLSVALYAFRTPKCSGHVLAVSFKATPGNGRIPRSLSGWYRHADLHWLDVIDRVWYKLTVTVHRCLHNKAPKYLTVCCVAVSDIAGRQRLRSAHRRQLDVPRYRRTTLVRRAFSVAGPTVWNSLPDELREETENTFRLSLKTSLFRQY